MTGLHAMLASYFPDGEWTVEERGETGWNNTTRFVASGGRRYVARIYETHREPDKIRFEHAALLGLSQAALPFAVPVPVADRSGNTIARLGDGSGRYACLFAYAEGVRPDSSAPAAAEAVGVAVGRLSAALAALRIDAAPAYPPYYELDAAHASCPPARIAGFCESPPAPFREQAAELRRLHDEWLAFRRQTPALRSLPHQLIHGDVNDSNLLARPDDAATIAAVLDFEFCTRDARAMEPAVVLSGMLEREGAEAAIPAFLRGFASVVKLTDGEIDAIPALIRLRKLDVFVHFLGRWLDGVDPDETLRTQIADNAAGLGRLRELDGRLRQWCAEGLR